jgi:RNA polymerase sigma-70 factor (ECF subfamily)
VAAAGRGDAAAWRELVDAFSGRVYALIVHQCGDRELAEEITQATFVKVAAKVGGGDSQASGYSESGRFEAWLFRIAVNQLRDEMRRRRRQATSVDFAGTPPETIGYAEADPRVDQPDQPLLAAERNDALRSALGKLSEAERELLNMRYSADLSYPQIAEALDQPLGTVLARGHRALKKLKNLLAGQVDPI